MRFLVSLAFVMTLAFATVPPTVQAAGNLVPSKQDDPDTAQGKAALKAEKWQTAVERFTSVVAKDARNADAQNYLGFAYRKLGNFELALKHYELALQIDPNHKAAHEYIGEAYLETKQLGKAEQHFEALKKLCSFCEERRDLDRAIKTFKQKNNISS